MQPPDTPAERQLREVIATEQTLIFRVYRCPCHGHYRIRVQVPDWMDEEHPIDVIPPVQGDDGCMPHSVMLEQLALLFREVGR